MVRTPTGDPPPAYTFDGGSANRALELIGKHLGMFVQRHEVGEPGAFDGLTAARKLEKARAVARRLGLARVDDAPVGNA